MTLSDEVEGLLPELAEGRASHVSWAQFGRVNPDDPCVKDFGGPEWQDGMVAVYDHRIDVVKRAADALREAGL